MSALLKAQTSSNKLAAQLTEVDASLAGAQKIIRPSASSAPELVPPPPPTGRCASATSGLCASAEKSCADKRLAIVASGAPSASLEKVSAWSSCVRPGGSVS